ncbi:hypothetical protein LWI28_000498 [Acer negundo]|uniref:GAG-pre-integrase domain-containing protein n=1 Tax=Acer negundo TaxID=4023 RepID=A0AAD5NL24_ACENE|nr:hypothetical protein LWI28_000498 [Acer negundo]
MVHSWIINTLSPEISDSVIYYAAAHEVWEDLRERFSQSNAPHIFEIQRDIAYVRQKQLSVSGYYTKLKGLWDELASYNDAAYSSVSQEEKQRLLSSTSAATDSTSSAAMAVRSNSSSSKPTPARFERSDRSYGFQDFRSQERSTENLSGGRQTYYELHGYPAGHPKAKHNSGPGPRRFSNNNKPAPAANHVSEAFSKVDGNHTVGISKAQLQQLLSLLDNKNEGSSSQANAVTKPSLSKITSRSRIIDSGVTDHIASSSELFFHRDKKCLLPPVLLPSGEKANIIAKGSLPSNSVYYLRDVLCVPTFKVDLMLVSRLMRGLNCAITFFLYWCILQDLTTRRAIALGKQRDGLYYLVALATKQSVTTSTSPINQPACNLTVSSTDLWHNRLGHTSSRLSFITKRFLNISVESNNVCHICPLAK